MTRRFIYALGALTVISVIGLALYLPARAPVPVQYGPAVQGAINEHNFPAEIGGLKLNGLITGDEASRHISQLHGLGIPVQEAFMAMYGDQNRQLILYLSRSAREEEAVRLFQAMDAKMPGNKTFKGYKKVQSGSREMVYVKGAGMDNYYFRQGRANFWIGLIGSDPGSMVEDVLIIFKNYS